MGGEHGLNHHRQPSYTTQTKTVFDHSGSIHQVGYGKGGGRLDTSTRATIELACFRGFNQQLVLRHSTSIQGGSHSHV